MDPKTLVDSIMESDRSAAVVGMRMVARILDARIWGGGTMLREVPLARFLRAIAPLVRTIGAASDADALVKFAVVCERWEIEWEELDGDQEADAVHSVGPAACAASSPQPS